MKWRRKNNEVILEVKADEGVNYEICVPDGVQSAVKTETIPWRRYICKNAV